MTVCIYPACRNRTVPCAMACHIELLPYRKGHSPADYQVVPTPPFTPSQIDAIRTIVREEIERSKSRG